MTHTFSKSAFYSFGDIPLAGPLPLIFSQLLTLSGKLSRIGQGCRRKSYTCLRVAASAKAGRKPYLVPQLQEYHEHCKDHALIREVTFANPNLSSSAG